jgi:hypothetical protein
MNAHEIIEALLAKDGGPSALFPPLDDEGRSVRAIGPDSMVVIWADPDESDSPLFSLEMPLLSLEGAEDSVQLEFLWFLSRESTPGILPPGHVLFATRDDMMVSLGGRFSALGLEAGTLETLVDEFQRVGQVLREILTDTLETFASMGLAPIGGPAPAASESLEIPLNRPMIRV